MTAAPEIATTAAPALHFTLADACGEAPDDLVAPVFGPRLWWAGPLDVEGLALGSVQAALTAANVLVGRRRFAVDASRVGAWFASYENLRIDGRGTQAFAELSGFFRCADGWVRLHGNYPHHAAAIARALDLGEGAGREAAERALAHVSASEAERIVRAEGGVAAALRGPREWLSSPMGRAVDAEPWIRFTPAPAEAGGPHRRLDGGERALSGLRVLDLTRVIAGPTATRLLALLGADVLRVDPPHLPELLDQYVDTGFGKRSAEADLRDAATLARVRELLAGADVLISSYRPGALARFGLDAASLAHEHPGLAVVEIDAWGDAGPWRGERGFDSVVQAATGIAQIYARSDPAAPAARLPGALPVQALDHASGYGAAAAALALVCRRRESGTAGSAHLCLARTAHELFRLPGLDPSEADVTLDRSRTPSPYGELDHAAPAVLDDDAPLSYGPPPNAYGSNDLTWW